MKSANEQTIHVEAVNYHAGYSLEIVFSDGKRRIVDFEPFLRSSTHPEIRKYLDKKKFKQFTVTHGVLNWNDFDLVFPMAELYEGVIR